MQSYLNWINLSWYTKWYNSLWQAFSLCWKYQWDGNYLFRNFTTSILFNILLKLPPCVWFFFMKRYFLTIDTSRDWMEKKSMAVGCFLLLLAFFGIAFGLWYWPEYRPNTIVMNGFYWNILWCVCGHYYIFYSQRIRDITVYVKATWRLSIANDHQTSGIWMMSVQ